MNSDFKILAPVIVIVGPSRDTAEGRRLSSGIYPASAARGFLVRALAAPSMVSQIQGLSGSIWTVTEHLPSERDGHRASALVYMLAPFAEASLSTRTAGLG